MTTEIIIVRHGETEWNLLGKIQGVTNIQLTENGKEQAVELSDRLQKEGELIVYSSPLDRAVYTANKISNNNTIIHEGLKEVNFGSWEGRTFPEIFETKLFQQFYNGEENGPFGDAGDSVVDCSQRNRKLIDEIAQKHPGKKIVLVSHGAWIRCSILGLMNLKDPIMYHNFHLGNTGITRFLLKNNRWVMTCFNDHTHLSKGNRSKI